MIYSSSLINNKELWKILINDFNFIHCIFIFFSFYSFHRSKLISKSTLLNIFFTLLGLIIFKDGSIMPDYQVYKDNYFKIANGNFDILLEPSYILICYIFSPFGDIDFTLF